MFFSSLKAYLVGYVTKKYVSKEYAYVAANVGKKSLCKRRFLSCLDELEFELVKNWASAKD